MNIEFDNLKALIDQIFIKEPNAVINVYYNGKHKFTIGKDEWEDESEFVEIKAMCETYEPPTFVKRHSLFPLYFIDLGVN